MRRTRAFTLIELLVVIAIIGVLVGITAYGLSSLGVRGRNSTRKADLERIKNVLEQYNTDARSYPAFDSKSNQILAAEWQLADSTCHTVGINTRLAPSTKYFDKIPADPRKKISDISPCDASKQVQSQMYLYIGAGSSAPEKFPAAFALLATLERPTDASDLFDANTAADPFAPAPIGPARFSFYGTLNARDAGYGVDANYIITGGR